MRPTNLSSRQLCWCHFSAVAQSCSQGNQPRYDHLRLFPKTAVEGHVLEPRAFVHVTAQRRMADASSVESRSTDTCFLKWTLSFSVSACNATRLGTESIIDSTRFPYPAQWHWDVLHHNDPSTDGLADRQGTSFHEFSLRINVVSALSLSALISNKRTLIRPLRLSRLGKKRKYHMLASFLTISALVVRCLLVTEQEIRPGRTHTIVRTRNPGQDE
jgi:hypothetical protein